MAFGCNKQKEQSGKAKNKQPEKPKKPTGEELLKLRQKNIEKQEQAKREQAAEQNKIQEEHEIDKIAELAEKRIAENTKNDVSSSTVLTMDIVDTNNDAMPDNLENTTSVKDRLKRFIQNTNVGVQKERKCRVSLLGINIDVALKSYTRMKILQNLHDYDQSWVCMLVLDFCEEFGIEKTQDDILALVKNTYSQIKKESKDHGFNLM